MIAHHISDVHIQWVYYPHTRHFVPSCEVINYCRVSDTPIYLRAPGCVVCRIPSDSMISYTTINECDNMVDPA